MSQKTPAIIQGLKEGPYTVRLSHNSDITFEDQEVYVYPYSLIPVDGAANTSQSAEIIVDSPDMREEPFTVNGHVIRKTLPSRITAPLINSFVTVYHNLSYVSYVIPSTLNEDYYFEIEPRQYSNINVFVDSTPRGAEVFIDGFRTGFSTPYLFTNISDGPHRIMVSKHGYIPKESVITLLYTSGPMPSTDVRFVLEEYQNGFLRVTSDPPAAGIALDGRDTGEVTPFMFSRVPTGTHSVTVFTNNITREYDDITVNALRPANINADLNEIKD
jgi:hypothetical protein